MSAAISGILSLAGDIAFFSLGVVAVLDRLRRPDRTPLVFVLALGLLGLTGAMDMITNLTDSRYQVVTVLSALLFSASGYALVEFRSLFVPLTQRGRRIVIVVEVIALMMAIYVSVATPGRYGLAGIYAVSALGLIGTWIYCVGDSIFRLWRASSRRPAVQRARLRTLCAGYGLIVMFLVVNVVGTGLIEGGQVPLVLGNVLEVCIVLAAPLLYLSFAPPSWMRRLWRASEEDRFSDATREMLLFSPDVDTLARRSLEWASRLVGAEAGYIVDWQGKVLGTSGISVQEALNVQRRLPAQGLASIVRLGVGHTDNAIVVPLSFEIGTGRLVVIAGAYTPLFGEDEIARLIVYSVAVTAALDRARLVQEIQRVNAELELRVDERTAALRSTNTQLEVRNEALKRLDEERKLLLQRVVTAQEQERRRIARDLHDDAVQVMSAVNMRVGMLRQVLPDERDRTVADKLEETVTLAIGRLRHLLFELSPPALENQGLVVALERRLQELAADSSFTYEIIGDKRDDLPPETRLLIYRVTQEALINVQKHAQARHVTIEVAGSDGGTLVRIVDNGRGFDPERTDPDRPGHIGMVGMRERAEMAGGWWRVESRAGSGTKVEFWVPGPAAAPTAATA